MEVKESKSKKVLQNVGLAALLAGSYGLFFSQTDEFFIRWLSQKQPEFIAGIDFQAYKEKEKLGLKIVKRGDNIEEIQKKEITNWYYSFDGYTLRKFAHESLGNILGFTPYYGDVGKDKPDEIIEKGDEIIQEVVKYLPKEVKLLLRIKGDPNLYTKLKEPDPLMFITKKLVSKYGSLESRIIIELEAPDNKDIKAHEKRISLIKETNPNMKVATCLDMEEGYNKEKGIWDPELTREYWKNSDIIILEDYLSSPRQLKKSILKFKEAIKGTKKQIWVRIITGTKRINEGKFKSLEAELYQYGQLLETAKEYADGCLASDSTGVWFVSPEKYDKGERLDKTKEKFMKFRRIKIDK